MSTFFVTHEGNQLGPYTKDQISALLKDGKLQWSDYLFDDVLQDWVHIMEHGQFTKEFNVSFKNPVRASYATAAASNYPAEDLKKRNWFVLKDDANYGPFSKAEIVQMLQCRTLFEFDHIWREGLESWKKLSEVDEFTPEHIKAMHQLLKTPLAKEFNHVFFRRKHVRAKMQTRVIIHDQIKVYNSESLEISEGGASLKITGAQFELNQKLYLHFSPGVNTPQFNVICKVVSLREETYGVQFLNVSGVVKSFISNYTNDLKKVA